MAVVMQARVVRWPIEPHGAARDRTLREAVIVSTVTPGGAVGYGEAAPLAPGDSIATVLRALADPRIASPSARFAVETAALDALAKERGLPLAALLGAPSAITTAVVVDEPGDVRGDERCIKIKVGADGDLDRVRAIATAAPQATLRLDANCSWPRDRVHAWMAALADLPIEFVEEPCLDAHELVDDITLPLPIALDESLAMRPVVRGRRLAAIVLKPTLLGGLRACLELAARARANGVAPIVTHGLEGPVGTAACRALACAIGGDRAHGIAPHPALAGWDVASEPGAPGLGLDAGALEDAVIALRDPLTLARPARSSTRARCVVAHPSHATLDAIHAALHERRPLALLHARTPAAELARQRALVDAAALADGEVVLFTSGSTGTPRGVVLAREALIAAAAANAAHLGWDEHDRWLLALSMAHAGGLAIVVRCLAAGRDVVLVEDSRDLAAKLARCTLASLVPTQLAQLLEDPAWTPPPRLRAVLLGGAAAPPALLAAAAARGVPFLPTYGATETFGQVATAPLERAGDPSAPLVPLANVVLAAGTRDSPAPIRIRAPSLAARYLDGEPIASEWTSRDLGFLDGGALHVVGRSDDVIITGGENVHPQTVEAILAATPGVRAACAFGIADDRWGQRVVAALAVDPSFELGAAVAHWRTALPPHAVPRELATVRELPLSPAGKLDRRAVAYLPRSPIAS